MAFLMVFSWVEPMKIPLVLAMKIWWITHENLVNFPWTNSQDFNGFLFSSIERRLIRELTVEQSMNREKSWNTVVIRE